MADGVAVIGLGYFSRFHLAAWAARPDIAILGVTDLDPARRAKAAADWGVRAFDDAGSLLAAGPRIVDIVAPPAAHAELVAAALAPGRVVICQKPFCRDLDEAAGIAAAAEAAGTTLVIHENFRFQPWHRTIKSVLGAGRLGAVWQARFALRPGDGRGADAYRARQPAFREMPRFLIHETGVHFIDLFRWMFGEIEGVYARTRRLNPAIAGEDAGLLLLDHVTGTASQFDGNRLADHAAEDPRRTMGEMEVVGEGGTLALDGAGRVRLRPFGARGWEEVPHVAPVDPASFGGGCVAALIAHVAERLDRPATIENRAGDYLPVIAAVEAAYRSAASGRREVPVTLPGTPG